MAFIEIRDLTYAYENDGEKGTDALKNLSFSVEKGEFVALPCGAAARATFTK